MSPLAPNPGESYYDIIARLDPVMLELLSTEEPVLIVSHQATLRMVRGFLMRTPRGLPSTRDPTAHRDEDHVGWVERTDRGGNAARAIGSK